MKRRPTARDWLPLAGRGRGAAEVPTGAAFRPEWIDVERGIRVGNLEPHERITQVLKHRLQEAYRVPFVVDRWGRGQYWQWICWVPRPDRDAKTVSAGVNFGCAKFYVSIDRGTRAFTFGLAVERGIVRGRPRVPAILLRDDWDWHRLMAQCRRGTIVDAEIGRLIREEGFTAAVGGTGARFTSANWRSAAQVRAAAARAPAAEWAGFDLFYAMPIEEAHAASGIELVEAVTGGFAQVRAVMNACMQVSLVPAVAAAAPRVYPSRR